MRPAPTADQRTGVASGAAGVVYAVFAYVMFLATVLWMVLWLADAPIPKTVDSGTSAGVGGAVIDLALVLLFAVQHSVMARSGFKSRLHRLIPAFAERSTYVLSSAIALGILLAAWQPLPSRIWQVDGPGAAVILAVFIAGVLSAVAATFMINHFDFTGLRQAWLHRRGRRYTALAFQERWLYRYIRHPIVLGFLITFWATWRMSVGHLLFAVAATLYLAVGTTLEERDLRADVPEYDEYRARVPAVFPVTVGRRRGA